MVKDLGRRSPGDFLAAVRERFDVASGPATPVRHGDIAMYVNGAWYTLRTRTAPDAANPIASLDVSVLQEQLLAPMLEIADVRTDKRIDFVGGGRGTAGTGAAWWTPARRRSPSRCTRLASPI